MSAKQTAPKSEPRSPKATWGFACGCVAVLSAIPFVPGPYFEYLFGIAAIVLGYLGYQEVARGVRGRGMSVAAVVLGALAIAYKIATQTAVFG